MTVKEIIADVLRALAGAVLAGVLVAAATALVIWLVPILAR